VEQASPLVGASSAAGAASAPGRVQQLAASVTLGSTPANLQATSDQVAQLAVRDGGYVQSSNVQVQQQGASEATLALRLPSARLGAALAAIGRLAPIRAENQSLQDITDAYDTARQRLSDAEVERRALLRALAAATTEGRIDNLRERLSASRAAIARAHSSVNAVSQRASTAEVEVSILGDARAGSEGLTLHRGLHDAGRVLVVALIVILVAASILVPLALVLAALAGASSAWRRYQRERVLNGH
jgi:vacuolar-type H+-ATPase subunit H